MSKQPFEIAVQRSYKIAADNQLAQQKYTTKKSKGTAPTLAEEKALAFILSKIKPTAEGLCPIEFDIKEFCAVCGLNERYFYSPVKATLDGLLSRHVWLWEEDKKEHGRPYFEEITIDPGSAKVVAHINKRLEPLLIQLKGNYFLFTFRNILAMKTSYGIRLYKLLKSMYYKYTSFPAPIEFGVEELKEYLDCVGKYEKFYEFRRRIIDPALRDINTYSDLEVQPETIKTGKSITRIIFHTLDLGKEPMPEDQAEAQRRSRNVEKEINPDQFIFDGIFDNIGDWP